MHYSAHGQYAIKQQNNILFVDAQGPFNDVTAAKYHHDITEITNNMTGEPWGSLITFRGNSVFTPEAEKQLIETTRYRIQKGMVAIAVVILNSAYADMQQMQLQRIYQDCCISFHVFTNSHSAHAWLDSYIEQATPSLPTSKNHQNKKYQ